MKKYILLLIIPFLSFGQNDYVPQTQRDSEKKPIISEKLNDYLYVSNHPKSIHNFRVKTPHDFNFSREGRDNSTIKVFYKYIDSKLAEFSIGCLKWEDFPEHYSFLYMSNQEVEDYFIQLSKDRIKKFPDEKIVFYEINGSLWIIGSLWDNNKSLYSVTAYTYSNKQTIAFTLISGVEGNQKKDIKNIKKIIDSFNYIGK